MTLVTTRPVIEATDLTFGIEIETYIPSRSPLCRQIGGYHSTRANGGNISLLPNIGEHGETFGAERDCSISGTGTGAEFVSPVLKGAEGLQFIADTVKVLKADPSETVTDSSGEGFRGIGAKVNASCGVHVHVEIPSHLPDGTVVPIEALKRLYAIVAQHEDALEATTGTTQRLNPRSRTCYSRSIKNMSGLRQGKYKFKGKSKSQVRSDISPARYSTLNTIPFLTNLRPAVEFRLFSCSLNPQKLTAWVQECIALVQWALSTTKCVKWTSVGTNDNAHGGSRGTGEKNVNRMFYAIGWTAGRCRFEGLGDLGHPVYTIKSSKKVMRKMARKFDSRSDTQ